MRDDQREDEGECEDADHERLPVAHELDREPVGNPLAQARLLDRSRDEVGADDHPHLHLGPRGKYRLGVRGAGEDEEREIDCRDVRGLGDATGPPHDGHEREGEAVLPLRADLAERAQGRDPHHREDDEAGEQTDGLRVEFHEPILPLGRGRDAPAPRRGLRVLGLELLGPLLLVDLEELAALEVVLEVEGHRAVEDRLARDAVEAD